MSIRQATVDDVPALQRVRASVRENVLAPTTVIGPELVREYLEERGRGWVYETGGEVVGFAVADLVEGSVWALFVEPEWEGRGVGRALHDTMIECFRAEGAATVRLGTDPGTRAARFYERAGWILRGLDDRGEARYELMLG